MLLERPSNLGWVPSGIKHRELQVPSLTPPQASCPRIPFLLPVQALTTREALDGGAPCPTSLNFYTELDNTSTLWHPLCISITL